MLKMTNHKSTPVNNKRVMVLPQTPNVVKEIKEAKIIYYNEPS